MTNAVIRNEQAIKFNGLQGRAHNVVADTATGRILNQTLGFSKEYTEGGHKYRIRAEVRFDDECKNGHESFAITGTIDEMRGGGWRDYMGGCMHEEIAKHLPQLAPFIKWHLVSTDGPMHYLTNTLYLAGNLDYNGRAKGEPSSWSHAVRFGNSPITHEVKESFWNFLRQREKIQAFKPVAIGHAKDKGGYEFDAKWTFEGYADKWHECPFDTEREAQEWAAAMLLPVEFLEVPTSYSKGKARELEAARRAACWPEATDAQLCAPREELKAALEARLPGLLAEFRADVEKLGLLWPAKVEG